MSRNNAPVEIEEVTSVLTPAPGVSLDQALADARLMGMSHIFVDREKNQVVVTWYKRGEKTDLRFLGIRTGLS